MPRSNSSFSIAAFTAVAVASTAGVVSHVSRVIPSPASCTSSRSRSPRPAPSAERPTFSDVSAPAPSGPSRPSPSGSPRPAGSPAPRSGTPRQVEQQRWRVVLHRPVQQELLQLLQLRAARSAPASTPGTSLPPQMIATGLLPPPVLLQHAGATPQPIRQPQHRDRRHRPDLIGHEPQPRQRAQLNGQPQPRRRAPAHAPVVDEPHIRRVSVKNRISSSLPMSGNDRSRSICSSENNRGATGTPPRRTGKQYEP